MIDNVQVCLSDSEKAMSNDRPPIDCGSWGSTEIVGGDIIETFVWKIKGFKDHRETYKLNKMVSSTQEASVLF